MYFTVNDRELEALCGLTYIQQVTYFHGIRPYMDRQTQLVGVKRRISYQSISEALYIEPHQGIKESGSPSRQQIRRVIKGLERAGLVSIHSVEKQLILKCLLADNNYCIPNKADTNPTHNTDIDNNKKSHTSSDLSRKQKKKDNTTERAKADTPHKENNYIYLSSQFEKFWNLYPEKKSKERTFETFKLINPDKQLMGKILSSLKQQIQHRKLQVVAGNWVPPWKYPVNWLNQKCWEDEVTMEKTKERKYDAGRSNTGRKNNDDMFWIPDEELQQETNVIELNQFRTC